MSGAANYTEPLEIVGWVNSSSTENLLRQPIWYVIAFLNALPFNLVFRRFRMCDLTDYPSVHFRNVVRDLLARVLLYNVSLREVDFSGSDLYGLGRMLGGAVSVITKESSQASKVLTCMLSAVTVRPKRMADVDEW